MGRRLGKRVGVLAYRRLERLLFDMATMTRRPEGLDEVDDALQTPTRRLADMPIRFPYPPWTGGINEIRSPGLTK